MKNDFLRVVGYVLGGMAVGSFICSIGGLLLYAPSEFCFRWITTFLLTGWVSFMIHMYINDKF